MTKAELVDRVAKRLEGADGFASTKAVRRAMVSATIEAMIEEIGDALQQRVPVRISRLGTLSPELKKNRKMRNFAAGTFHYGTLWVLKFKAAAQLVERMRRT